MPNIIAHIEIGSEAGATLDPAYLLGCALPDFMGMYRDYRGPKLGYSDFDMYPRIARGIRMHHFTDRAYDSLSQVRTLKKELRADLATISPALGSGALRACADAGTDILLDGILLESNRTEHIYNRIRDQVLYAEELEAYGPDLNFVNFVQDYFANYASYRYQDPSMVAAMLERRFACRRGSLLAFDHEQIPDVAMVLAGQALRLRGAAEHIVAMTTEHIAYLDNDVR